MTDERVPQFVGQHVGRVIVPPFTCMGVEKGGEIVLGVVFNNYTRNDVHLTVAGRAWPRSFLAEVGRYVFDTLGCTRMTVVTEQPKVARLTERVGGQLEGCLRDHFGKGRDGFVLGVLKEEYRW